MKKLLLILTSVSSFTYAVNNATPTTCNESNVMIKKGSLITQTSANTFTMKKGCFVKCDQIDHKPIESCVE